MRFGGNDRDHPPREKCCNDQAKQFNHFVRRHLRITGDRHPFLVRNHTGTDRENLGEFTVSGPALFCGRPFSPFFRISRRMKDGQDARDVVIDPILDDLSTSSSPDNSDIVKKDRFGPAICSLTFHSCERGCLNALVAILWRRSKSTGKRSASVVTAFILVTGAWEASFSAPFQRRE